MKILSYSRFFWLISTIGIAIPSISARNNHLERLEVSQSDIGLHLLFDFVRNTQIKPHFNEHSLTLSLFFQQVRPIELKNNPNWGRLQKLHASGHLLNVELEAQENGTAGSILRIQFPKEIKTSDNSSQPNQLLIKWSMVETRGTRFIIDAISKNALDKIRKHGATILYATNDVVQNDFSSIAGLGSHTTSKAKERRIIIDAGHGGSDLGAKGYNNLCEKDIALQVSKRLAKKLKAQGYNVHLTRNDDRNVSLVSRSTLANQLKADAFISIHLNSAGKINSKTDGVETYFLAPQGMLPPTHVGGYYFVNTAEDQALIDALNKHTRSKIEASKSLATCVQNHLVRSLRHNNVATKDRGVKSAHLRLLLRNNVPTALVEIGFITNPREAAALSSQKRQEIITDGIMRGLKRYFEQEI